MAAIVAFLAGMVARAEVPTAPTSQPSRGLSDAQLLTVIQRELDKSYEPRQIPQYLAAHSAIESYFATASMKDRSEIAKGLQSTGLHANTIGRLLRIRRGWQDLTPGAYFLNDTFGPFEVKYFLGVPRTYNRLAPSPVVIVLPTADAFLTNPPPDNQGVTDIYKRWVSEELERHFDALIVIPLLNLDELYGPSRPGMNSVMQSLHHAADQVNIDPQRVYLMGHSLGGHATWNLALHFPTYFAAIAPLGAAAGADWQRLRLMNLRNVLPVVWHDTDDEIIPIESTRSLVRAIRGMKLDIQYVETKNLGHHLPGNMMNQIVEPLRARQRDLYPKEVFIQSNKPDTPYNRADWIQIYQPMRSGGEKRLNLQRGTGPMLVYQNTFNVKATVADNRVTATSDNVELMRFFFNDQTVDFNRAVTVMVNGRNRVETTLKPDIDAMLRDAAFMGRGWRYYSAFIDIDFGPPPTTRSTSRPATRPSTHPSTRPATSQASP